MEEEDLLVALMTSAIVILYLLPTIIAWWRRHPSILAIGVVNLAAGWTVIGWIVALVRALGHIQPPPVVRMSEGRSEPRPEDQYVGIVSRLLELPPADRVLSLRTGDGRAIQLVLDSERPLTLRLEGNWTEREKATARALMQAAVESRPDLARRLNPDDPVQGVVFSTQNPYSVSELIYQLATEGLKTNPARLVLDKDYQDHDARPEIVAMLKRQGAAEILHEESGVRVRVTLGEGYGIKVPTAALDPGRGQLHRARQAIQNTGWRLYDGDTGSPPELEEGSVDDPANCWGFAVDSGDAKEAADAALRLLCEIAEIPVNVRVSVLAHPSPGE